MKARLAEGKPLRPPNMAHLMKRPSDSSLSVVLPFGSDPEFRKRYVNFRGQLRIGLLLEELGTLVRRLTIWTMLML